MRAALVAAALLPGSGAAAEVLSCTLETDCAGRAGCRPNTETLRFDIDRRQFAPPVDRNEPPRVKRTTVYLGPATFVAEPFLVGQTRGFWDDASAPGARMLTVLPGGLANYTDTGTGVSMSGTCVELR